MLDSGRLGLTDDPGAELDVAEGQAHHDHEQSDEDHVIHVAIHAPRATTINHLDAILTRAVPILSAA